MKPFGVSFIVRVRNEEKTLDRALASLAKLSVDREIIVILNRCTDDSVKIALRRSAHQPITIAYDDVALSRPGAETLITDAHSPHSLASYYQRSFARASFRWTFKYDADFAASEALVSFLNEELSAVDLAGPTRLRLPCRWQEKGRAIANEEIYLSNCLTHFTKSVFWEVPNWSASTEILRRDIPIEHVSTLADVKDYWRDPPWFMYGDGAEEKELRRRWGVLRSVVGEEPIGAARASNPECDAYYLRVQQTRERLEREGISFYR